MKIIDRFPKRKTMLSLEVFPPKTEKGMENLKTRMRESMAFYPAYISVTYGAGGSTRQNTLDICQFIQNDLDCTAMAHLTCVGQSRAEILETVRAFKTAGIQNIMALRGDPPQGETAFKPHPEGLAHASDLIALIAEEGGFSIGCAAYCEGHIEASSIDTDIDYLKKKIDAGAEFIVTQFFLDNSYFLRFRDKLHRNGIDVPLIAGILPITNYSQITRFSLICGCTIPAPIMRGLYGKSDEDQEAFGLDYAAAQVEELLLEQVDGIHIYALNKRRAVRTLAPIVRKKHAPY